MARVVIDTSAFEAEIEGVISRAANPQPALEAFARYQVGSVKRNFKEEGRPDPWKPLKVNTLIARYLRRKEGQRIKKKGGQFDPNPNVFKDDRGRIGQGSYDKRTGQFLGDVGAVSTVTGMARSTKTGRVLRGKHGGLNKFAPGGMVFRRAALRAILQGKILQDTGRLRGSINFEMQGKSKVGIGTNVIYAATHQFGDAKRGIPARPFLVVQPDDEEEFLRLVAEYVRGDWG